MTDWLRRAGRGIDPTGATVIWTVSEGTRGRRWREARVAPEGGLISSLLLETDPEGRFLHTELSTADGLLTLHPEGDGTLHGNVVTRGFQHVVGRPWSPDGVILLEGSTLCLGAAAYLADRHGVGEDSLRVGLDLTLDTHAIPIVRSGRRIWRIGEAAPVEIDADGLPVLAESASWPLEIG